MEFLDFSDVFIHERGKKVMSINTRVRIEQVDLFFY